MQLHILQSASLAKSSILNTDPNEIIICVPDMSELPRGGRGIYRDRRVSRGLVNPI